MKLRIALLLVTLSTTVFAHPGGGIIALSENSVVFADPVENFIWLIDKGKEPEPIVSKFHGHWLTRGLDGNLYAEKFQASDGIWRSAAFQLTLPGAKLTEVAHRRDIGALVFAVDRDRSLVFQRGPSLVSRRNGKEEPFRSSLKQPGLGNVTAYAWDSDGDLFFADRNKIHRVDRQGVTSLIAHIEGKVLEPRIWNATDTPSIFSIVIDAAGRVLAAMPDLGKVYRIEANRIPREVAPSQDRWRATGVATFRDCVFLLESDSRTSTSPRVRILRPGGTIELFTVPGQSK
jgi:hypothetical protein